MDLYIDCIIASMYGSHIGLVDRRLPLKTSLAYDRACLWLSDTAFSRLWEATPAHAFVGVRSSEVAYTSIIRLPVELDMVVSPHIVLRQADRIRKA